MNDDNPALMFASPSWGPMLTSSTMRAGAGRDPAFKRLERSSASMIFCSADCWFPKLICERPFVIADWTFGALNTRLSSTTATALLFSAAHFLAEWNRTGMENKTASYIINKIKAE